jgi:tetratricopeptide (TPR) repeat protein
VPRATCHVAYDDSMNAIAVLLAAAVSLAVAQQPADQTKENLTQAQKLMESGDVAGAVTLLQATVKAAPQSSEAHLALGRALDLDGDHKTARRHLEQAISLATDSNRNQALSAMGVSWAFESKPDEAARYYQRIFDAQTQAKDRGGAAGTANALGRIYLESGNLDKAEQWYRTGHETAKQIPELPENQIALWEMRWHNAQGRIAARRKNASAAAEHAKLAKSALDKSGNKNQQAFHPYLLGYIAFYGGQYKQAIDDLLQGDQQDPFILGLIAQAQEKLGDRLKAREFYEKVMAVPFHSINTAFARPRARAYLRRR